MRDSLAEELLVKVTDWSLDILTKERLDLQLLADYKYDEYQQFAPGMRFIENLALWLKQFKNPKHRQIAYDFIKRKLIFVSTQELHHLIRMTYPDVIKPYLIKHVSKKLKIDEFFIKKILNDDQFDTMKRKCLFLGLSDGARLDILRRFSPELKHEQIYPTYLITKEKAEELKDELNHDLSKTTNTTTEKYELVFLIDDFSASGISYIRKESSTAFAGKIAKFLRQIISNQNNENHKFIEDVIDTKKLKLCVILYIATDDALEKIRTCLKEYVRGTLISIDVFAVQVLTDSLRLGDDAGAELINLLKSTFNPKILTPQYEKGKHDRPYMGFNEGGLPLVLSHNCPNNSLPILWDEDDDKDIRALFPRQQRYHGDL